MIKKFIFLLVIASNLLCFGQINGGKKKLYFTKAPHVEFVSNEFQEFGFDEPVFKEWISNYDTLVKKNFYLPIAFKSQGLNSTDQVDVIFHLSNLIPKDSIFFLDEKSGRRFRKLNRNDSTLTIFLPKRDKNYSIVAKYKKEVIGKLNVVIYAPKLEHLTIVPLIKLKINIDSLEQHLNKIYRQANVQFDVEIKPVFYSDKIKNKEGLSNPSPNHDRYTKEMRDIRDLYFKTFSNSNQKTNYVFVTEQFVDPKIKGYSVRKKAMSFIVKGSELNMAYSIAKQLGFGIGLLEESWKNNGPKEGTTTNLMDNGKGSNLSHDQWERLRHFTNSYSFYDNYEDVVTNNGIVAYYFWKEDTKGNIIVENNSFLESIKRPFKKNHKSYHLDVRDVLYKPLFNIAEFKVNLWHLISSLLSMGLVFYIHHKVFRQVKRKIRKIQFWKWMTRFLTFGIGIFFIWVCFNLIEKGYEKFEVKQGKLRDFKNFSIEQAIENILSNKNLKRKTERTLSSELLIKKDSKWYVKTKKRVLYFNVAKVGSTDSISLTLIKDSDTLNIEKNGFNHVVETHYMVFNYLENEKLIDQRVFNHVGIELTDKLKLADPAKRILMFVNGYRPTSIGHSFEENFYDVQKYGLEFANSNNLIYNFDRYDYWRPWQQFDLLFQKRLNPSESYYADGHFSVSTSNHRSLINFTSVSTIYPERCKIKNKHVCYYTTMAGAGMFGSKRIKTIDLHRTRPNRKGFKERRENGRIAGRNFLQLCNEIPNRSQNDTVYIVAHSMGYAYALGMIDELRGKINFGGFYILAPENASAGKVRQSEWKEIWQYGSNFNKGKSEAACLLDGVAPQIRAAGLNPNQRIYIPEYLYPRKGFYDSHFIGYYTWIFSIEKGKKGYISQR